LIDEEEERGNSRLHLEIMDKQNVEELRQELKNLDWSKYARYQSMTAEERSDIGLGPAQSNIRPKWTKK
jgi:hypothetical protein